MSFWRDERVGASLFSAMMPAISDEMCFFPLAVARIASCRFVLNATELDLGNPYFDTPTKLFKDLWNADEKRKAGDK